MYKLVSVLAMSGSDNVIILDHVLVLLNLFRFFEKEDGQTNVSIAHNH